MQTLVITVVAVSAAVTVAAVTVTAVPDPGMTPSCASLSKKAT